MEKCQRCPSPATVHVTEVLGEGKWELVNLCESCFPKYMNEADPKKAKNAGIPFVEADEGLYPQQACPHCGLKFVDFRNSHRLGCPHDYDTFRAELTTLLDNIHGETKHCGKMPRRYPQTKKLESELTQLRVQLKQAVQREEYESAARLRDRIKTLEEA
jgi:protein arginine kinase activator